MDIAQKERYAKRNRKIQTGGAFKVTAREENEKKKEFLYGYKKKTRKIESLMEQKKSLIAEMETAKAIQYSDMPKGTRQSDLSDYIVKLEKLSERIEDTKYEKNSLRLSIEEHIIEMDDGNESDVLRKRYIEMKSWETIKEEMHFSLRNVYIIHGKALIHFKLAEEKEDCI